MQSTNSIVVTGFTPAYLTFGGDVHTPDDVHRNLRAIVENNNFIPQITLYLLTLGNVLQEAKGNQEMHQDVTKNYDNEDNRASDCKPNDIGDDCLLPANNEDDFLYPRLSQITFAT
ncbi:hypothetical protein NQ314_006505 [Rhamnusium bicolor]|uniref:Uncharacterized protein n=1 Tax=Rhamnusium bicolor TaxID=1586634 RepID=A0AAV8Z3S5_9CUCU|nr:hypothetical protein NQ314_006505 [Rhamnusium bicolor]